MRAAGTVTSARDQELEDAILEALEAGEMTEPELRQVLGTNATATGQALRHLLESNDPERRAMRSGSGRRGDPYRYSRCQTPSWLELEDDDCRDT